MKQAFAWWSLAMGVSDDDAEAFLADAARVGVTGVEMLPEQHWPAARAAGLANVSINGHTIEKGFNDVSLHAALQAEVTGVIDKAAAAEIPLVIVFSGNRLGSDQEAIRNCVDGLAPLAKVAESSGVTLVLEALNSKIDHPGYHCDNSAFGFEVVDRVGSDGLKLLYDVYHMQLMEGDIINTIKAHLPAIGHIHTAGVPGRRELDDRQETNWRAIAGALEHLGYDGWVGHEFVPRQPAIDALRQAVDLFAPARPGA